MLEYQHIDEHSMGFQADTAEPSSTIYRPIQYLGSKLRTIDALMTATTDLYGAGDRVVDAFSGSSVVAQAFANAGCAVTAVDPSPCCARLAAAMLGVRRAEGESLSQVARTIVERLAQSRTLRGLTALLDAERRAMADSSGGELAAFSRELPQVWRYSSGQRWLEKLRQMPGEDAFERGAIATTHYAGTYFGIQQAAAIDAVRVEIEMLRRKGDISPWVENGLVSALLSAMSRAVFSAGKHFAQPMLERPGINDSFYRSRLLSDRSVGIAEAFIESVARIEGAVKDGNHSVYEAPIEDVYADLRTLKPALVYADPPYTAQQYSRFYHVLDVIADYRLPQLQTARGKITRGLYGEGRYKSPYSSKSSAPEAFELLVGSTRRAGSSFAVSYSLTATGQTGNARMIDFDLLKRICTKQYGENVREIRMDHSYRQFNSARRSKHARDEPEIILVCEA